MEIKFDIRHAQDARSASKLLLALADVLDGATQSEPLDVDALLAKGSEEASAAEPPPIAESQASAVEPKPTVAPAAPEKKLDDVKAALQALIAGSGMPVALELLKTFGASRVSDLKKEQYAGFIAASEK